MTVLADVQQTEFAGGASGPGLESFHTRLLDSLYDGIYFVDAERRITYWNKSAEELTGYKSCEVLGKRCFDNLLCHVDESGRTLCLDGCPLNQTISDGQPRECDVYLRHKQGHRVAVSIRASPIRLDEGPILGAVEVFSDISAKRTLGRLAGGPRHSACIDEMTGVANRRYLELKIQQALQEIQGFERSYGLVLIGIDGFDDPTGRRGIGDFVLKTVCTTISHAIRPGDTLGRWSANEILFLASDVTSSILKEVAGRCRGLIEKTSLSGIEEGVRITSLVATLLRADDSLEAAIRRIDLLMEEDRQMTGGGNH